MRITGGTLRSRRLVAPRSTATRPTQDRVREALFSILASRGLFEGAQPLAVLDLYAGTGALGLEALSRGAATARFVERARDALAALSENVRSLGLSARAAVVAQPVERWIDAPPAQTYSLVFCDPPYADLAAVTALLGRLRPHLEPGATLVLEHAAKSAPGAIEGLEEQDRRTYGDTALSFYVAG